jgi:uroporphyrinogen-III synthase
MRKTVLITRPEAQARKFAELLPTSWHPVIAPLVRIVPTGEIPDLSGVSGLLATSANGISSVADHLKGSGLPVWCVGQQTAKAAQKLGLETFEASGNAKSLNRMIQKQKPTGRLLYLSGRHKAFNLTTRLVRAGFDVSEVEVYDQQPLRLTSKVREQLQDGLVDVVTLFSPRTAEIFARETEGYPLELSRIICLSQNVADALGDPLRVRAEVAKGHGAQAIIKMLKS